MCVCVEDSGIELSRRKKNNINEATETEREKRNESGIMLMK